MVRENYFYVPDTFRACRMKNGEADIVTVKTINGSYIGDSRIKKLTGFHAKDTGSGQEELIAKEVTGVIKEFPNDWYEGISIIDKRWFSEFREYCARLHHPLGFNFYIKTIRLEEFILTQSIDIISKVLQCKFKFALNNSTNQVELISERSDVKIKTEQDILNLKKSISIIKTNQLEIGKIYKYYETVDPNDDSYKRIIFLGRLKHSKWLLKGDYYRDPEYISDEDYLVFIYLAVIDQWNSDQTDCNILGKIGPQNVILMKNSGRRLRSLDEDQCYRVYNLSDSKWESNFELKTMIDSVNRKIDHFYNKHLEKLKEKHGRM